MKPSVLHSYILKTYMICRNCKDITILAHIVDILNFILSKISKGICFWFALRCDIKKENKINAATTFKD